VRDTPDVTRLEVLPPGDPRAASALYAFMEELSVRWFGRPVSDAEVREGLRDFPSDDLQPPHGLLVVAHRDGAAVGCAGLRFVEEELGEATRVYVAPAERRRGLARALMSEVERLAREHGIARLRLDTRADLVEARRLYEGLGYTEVPRFNDSIHAGHWFEKRLGA